MAEQIKQKVVVNNYGCGYGCGVIVLAFIILSIFANLSRWWTGPVVEKPKITNEKTTLVEQTELLGKAERNIGRQQINLSSQEQAKELLKLINELPKRADYRIVYQTDIDIVIFGADMVKGNILRLHNRPDGTGTAEHWAGHVIYRLKQAAESRSLNDTPAGKLPATYSTF